jgi:hypothetical protein
MKKLLTVSAVMAVLVFAPTGVFALSHIQLFDMSGSASAYSRVPACNGAKLYIQLTPGALGRVGQFPPASITWSTSWTKSTATLTAGVDTSCPDSPSGGTPLYDAIITACNALGNQATPRQLMVYTDLGHNGSATLAQAVTAAVNNAVNVVIIRYNSTATNVNGDGTSDPDQIATDIQTDGTFAYYLATTEEEIEAAILESHIETTPLLSPIGVVILVLVLAASALVFIRRKRMMSV